MKLNRMLFVTLCCFTFLACESTEEKTEMSATSTHSVMNSDNSEMNSAKSAIISAKDALSIATKNNYSWKSTAKILKKAQASFDKKEFSKAIKLAKKAETQALLAEKQRQQQLARVTNMFE